MSYNRYMEMLKIAKNGQWELVQKDERNPEFASSPDMNMMSYKKKTIQGKLPEDYGNKGELHNVGTTRAARQNSKEKMQGKVPYPVKSAARDRSPGLF